MNPAILMCITKINADLSSKSTQKSWEISRDVSVKHSITYHKIVDVKFRILAATEFKSKQLRTAH
jgi:hypothetical protein